MELIIKRDLLHSQHHGEIRGEKDDQRKEDEHSLRIGKPNALSMLSHVPGHAILTSWLLATERTTKSCLHLASSLNREDRGGQLEDQRIESGNSVILGNLNALSLVSNR